MAIYTEKTDPNEREMTAKDILIEKINYIILENGNFTTYEVEADHSPFLESKGRLSHLAEEFFDGGATIRVYDPKSYSSDVLDEYNAFFEEFEERQLEYILELAETWEVLNI